MEQGLILKKIQKEKKDYSFTYFIKLLKLNEKFNFYDNRKTNYGLMNEFIEKELNDFRKIIFEKSENELNIELSKKIFFFSNIKNDGNHFLKEFFSEIMEINEKYNSKIYKTRKYKKLYFIYVGFINFFGNDENFFLKKHKWWAFTNGPVLDTYVFSPDEDESIILKTSSWNELDFKLFILLEKTLSKFNTNKLLSESHITNPWKNKYKINEKGVEMDSNEIREYFKKEKPFYLKNNLK